ncbi:MAG: dihydroorotase [Alistipes sp.]|nr:dihydroorotase [Alistipes sp.]MBR5595012.1 dihydroorotase [Alistipes sp.]
MGNNRIILKNGDIIGGQREDILIVDGIIAERGSNIEAAPEDVVIDATGLKVAPAFVDVHVHLREPGYGYKERIATGTMAAARGGYTTVCSMPNLSPVPDSVENLKAQQEIIDSDAKIEVLPYAAITIGRKGEELVDVASLHDKVCAFSDDGSGVQVDGMMERAMSEAVKHDALIAAHCEVEELLKGGYIHDGEYARQHNHKGICSESEWEQVKRDIEIAEKLGCRYHVCHISTKETVELVRQAKARGVKVTCETGPHYLIFTDMDLEEDARWKMNPPIRSAEDRAALIEGIKDGTIDMIATDHAPHSLEEKSRGLKDSAMGIVGLETAFAALNTHLVKTGVIDLEHLVKIMSINPRKVFRIQGGLNIGDRADIVLLDTEREWVVDSDKFYSMGKVSMFVGRPMVGDVAMTIHRGNVVYENKIK